MERWRRRLGALRERRGARPSVRRDARQHVLKCAWGMVENMMRAVGGELGHGIDPRTSRGERAAEVAMWSGMFRPRSRVIADWSASRTVVLPFISLWSDDHVVWSDDYVVQSDDYIMWSADFTAVVTLSYHAVTRNYHAVTPSCSRATSSCTSAREQIPAVRAPSAPVRWLCTPVRSPNQPVR
jgi:hypothetical protein